MELCPSQSSSEGFCCLGKKLFTTVVLSTFEKGYARPGEEKTLLGEQRAVFQNLKLFLLKGGIGRCQDDEPSDRVPEQLTMWRWTSGSSQSAAPRVGEQGALPELLSSSRPQGVHFLPMTLLHPASPRGFQTGVC